MWSKGIGVRAEVGAIGDLSARLSGCFETCEGKVSSASTCLHSSDLVVS